MRIIALSGFMSGYGTPYCTFDHPAFGELAARHLSECGFSTLATVSISSHQRLEDRRRGFEQMAHKLQRPVHHFTCHGMDEHGIDRGLIAQIVEYKPVGIYAVNDAQGAWLREQLLKAEVKIPTDAGILGTGNHRSSCLKREPFLSSIAFPWPLIGHEISRIIHHLVSHSTPPVLNTLRPYRVIARSSTQTPVPADPLVARATNWMTRHLNCKDPLAEACKAMNVSPNTLCRRFKKHLGISPGKYHEQARVARARELLAQTDLTINEISKLSGFRNATYFSTCFKKHSGCTPEDYRMK